MGELPEAKDRSSRFATRSVAGSAEADEMNDLSAYEVWPAVGNFGTKQDFLDSMIGASGTNGSEGQSAFALWVANGNPAGTEAEFLASLDSAPAGC